MGASVSASQTTWGSCGTSPTSRRLCGRDRLWGSTLKVAPLHSMVSAGTEEVESWIRTRQPKRPLMSNMFNFLVWSKLSYFSFVSYKILGLILVRVVRRWLLYCPISGLDFIDLTFCARHRSPGTIRLSNCKILFCKKALIPRKCDRRGLTGRDTFELFQQILTDNLYKGAFLYIYNTGSSYLCINSCAVEVQPLFSSLYYGVYISSWTRSCNPSVHLFSITAFFLWALLESLPAVTV